MRGLHQELVLECKKRKNRFHILIENESERTSGSCKATESGRKLEYLASIRFSDGVKCLKELKTRLPRNGEGGGFCLEGGAPEPFIKTGVSWGSAALQQRPGVLKRKPPRSWRGPAVSGSVWFLLPEVLRTTGRTGGQVEAGPSMVDRRWMTWARSAGLKCWLMYTSESMASSGFS